MSHLAAMLTRVRTRTVGRAALTLALACVLALGFSLTLARQWNRRSTARLNSAAARLDALTVHDSADARDHAAVAWGYAERLRLGLESPFRLIEAAGRDPRLSPDERHTVAWGLLAHVLRGDTHVVDAAALDGIGPMIGAHSVRGEQHLRIIADAIAATANPRAAELAVRFAYTLASSERLVDASAPVLAAEVAALLADREIARREAIQVVRSARGGDPLGQVRKRRERRAFYVERPTLLAPPEDLEDDAIELTPRVLSALRALRTVELTSGDTSAAGTDSTVAVLAPRLLAAGKREPPAAPLAVTVQRYLPMLRAQARVTDADRIGRAYNGEMLVAAASLDAGASRDSRRAVGRMLLAVGVAMRSAAQQPLWFGGDSVPDATDIASALGVADITFDRGVPKAWQPYFLLTFASAVRDVRRVLPDLSLTDVHVRFRTTEPADSALAMHDPRTRTLHLPVYTAAGTLTHELAHDLDRQSAIALGVAGYRSDIVARGATPRGRSSQANTRLAASLRAITEELGERPHSASTIADRPAEIFATRVDWFVASALARKGISDGFLSAVEDELLTGHVVHPERLRGVSRSRSLLTALEGMTRVAGFASEPPEPSVQTLLRWSVNGPVDRRVVSDILRGSATSWEPPLLLATRSCAGARLAPRAKLLRLAAESRARGWLRLRARWTPDAERPSWARAALGTAPWKDDAEEDRVARLRDYILVVLASDGVLTSGIDAYASPLVEQARCR